MAKFGFDVDEVEVIDIEADEVEESEIEPVEIDDIEQSRVECLVAVESGAPNLPI